MDKSRLVRVSKGVAIAGAVGAGIGLLVASVVAPQKKVNFAVTGFVFLGIMGAVFTFPSDKELTEKK